MEKGKPLRNRNGFRQKLIFFTGSLPASLRKAHDNRRDGFLGTCPPDHMEYVLCDNCVGCGKPRTCYARAASVLDSGLALEWAYALG